MLQIIIFFLALAISFPAISDEPVETISLQFVAEPGTKFSAELEAELIKVKNGIESVQRSVTGKIRLEIREHPDGFLFQSNNYDFKVETEDSDLKQYMNPFFEELYNKNVGTVVSESGEFLRLEGMQAILEANRGSLNKLIENYPDEVKATLASLMESYLIEESILLEVRQTWILAIQQWIGSNLQKGYVYEDEYLEAVPEFGNVNLGFNRKYAYLGKIPCNENDDNLSCIELFTESSLTPEYAISLTEVFTRKPSQIVEDNHLIELDADFKLVTEPSTLRIHKYEQNKVVFFPDEDGSGWSENIQKVQVEYSYD